MLNSRMAGAGPKTHADGDAGGERERESFLALAIFGVTDFGAGV